jgi:hypothetical protein
MPSLEKQRTNRLLEHLPDVLANIVVEYAGKQQYKKDIIQQKKIFKYILIGESCDNPAVNQIVEDFYTNFA